MLSTLLYPVAIAVLCTTIYVALYGGSWQKLLANTRALLLQSSCYSALPKQLSPDEQRQHAQQKLLELSLKETFPPTRRHLLSDPPKRASSPRRNLSSGVDEPSSTYMKLTSDKKAVDPNHIRDYITATGFRVDEIASLGNFPDYARLSGVSLPMPHADFEINTALPRPYRPFRWGYFQNMSLSKMEPDWWLELNHEYAKTVGYRQALFEERGPRVLQTLSGSETATKELMEMCLQFLCARYPQLFRLDPTKMMLYNDILHTTTDLEMTPPMHVLLNNVPEDFAIMLRDPDTGLYSFRGGIIMSSLGWDLGTKIGLQLHEIHKPVPDYKHKMRFSMDRYFAKMPTDKPIQRGSWGLEVDKPMYLPANEISGSRGEQDPALTINRVHLRVDWQTLRRLPLSGAIVFNFKCLFTPVTEFRNEPYIPSLLLKVLREGKKSLMEYKGRQTDHVTIPALEGYEKEQLERGLIEQNWEPRTLDESPFFPGWRQKWHV